MLRMAKQETKVRAKAEKEIDLEMEECLSKLKVWQTENLMAPRGMEGFVLEAQGRGSSVSKSDGTMKKIHAFSS